MDDRRFRVTARCSGTDRKIHPIGAHAPEAGKAVRGHAPAVVAALLAMLALLSAACSRTPPEEALRAKIAAMEDAAETRDAAGLAAHLAGDFVGPGGMDRDRFRRTAALLWLRSSDVGVTLGPLDVEVRGEHAQVRFTAITRGGAGILPDQAQVYDVDTAWRLQDGEWALISARWEPAL